MKSAPVRLLWLLLFLSCNLAIVPDEVVQGTIGGLNCSEATLSGILIAGQSVSNFTVSVPYNGGDRGPYSEQTLTSSGVTGLTATLDSGDFSSGNGSLVYRISGVPSSSGAASFSLNTGGQSCILQLPVQLLAGTVSTLNCESVNLTGILTAGVAASGVSISVTYTGGNGGTHNGQTVTSTGITGLTAILNGGNFSNGNGNLVYIISGIPSDEGTASFTLDIGGQQCTVNLAVQAPTGIIEALNCTSGSVTGSLYAGVASTGVSVTIPYTGGNGGSYSYQAVTSTDVTGLVASLAAGSFVSGSGTIVYSISGTPSASGTAVFWLNVGGYSCSLTLNVNTNAGSTCFAKISATQTKIFLCYNLGVANTNTDPFTPSWEINGGYWQWGRLAQKAGGPTGPNANQTNEGSGAGWNTVIASDGAWTDNVKTANDPCPVGFRIPTKAQWEGVIANNTKTSIGTWSNSPSNYSSGKKLGDNLFLPAAGYRNYDNGELAYRGVTGNYWSSTEYGSDFAWNLNISSNTVILNDLNRPYGASIRCIAY